MESWSERLVFNTLVGGLFEGGVDSSHGLFGVIADSIPSISSLGGFLGGRPRLRFEGVEAVNVLSGTDVVVEVDDDDSDARDTSRAA